MIPYSDRNVSTVEKLWIIMWYTCDLWFRWLINTHLHELLLFSMLYTKSTVSEPPHLHVLHHSALPITCNLLTQKLTTLNKWNGVEKCIYLMHCCRLLHPFKQILSFCFTVYTILFLHVVKILSCKQLLLLHLQMHLSMFYGVIALDTEIYCMNL